MAIERKTVESITVWSGTDAESIREALADVPLNAQLIGVDVDREEFTAAVGIARACLTFERVIS